MNREFEILDKRIRHLESQNRRLKWLGIVFVTLAMATTVWGQTVKNVFMQAQKFELRDDAGRLRAELTILDGEPALRFFDADGEVECLLDAGSYTIFKKGGDLQAAFAFDGLRFEDGNGKTFATLGAEEDQMGKLGLNDYRKKIYATVAAEDLAKLRPSHFGKFGAVAHR